MTDRQIDDPAALLDELCRHWFAAFVRKAWPLIQGGSQILWNWHLDALVHQLERVAKGETQRLIVNLPPRNAKSLIISVLWIAWRLGRDPTLNFVCVSYSNELSAKLGRDCIAVMQSSWYRALFPRTVISQKRTASHDFDTTAGGGRLATSTTGTLTGRGGDVVVLDDIIKPEDALSEVARNKVIEWFGSTLASRHDDKRNGPIILVMQRLNAGDLCGVLLERGGWDRLCLRAIATEDEEHPLGRGRTYRRKAGEVLHQEREPLDVLDGLKALMGSVAFAAQYQQEPVPAAGNVILAAWLKTYVPAALDRTTGLVIQSWDTATKENPYNAFSVCITALLQDRKVYLLDVFRRRLQFSPLKARAIALAREFAPRVLLIEDQSSGTQLLQTLRLERPAGVPDTTRCKPEGDKNARVGAVSAMIEAGRLFLPGDASWLHDFKAEVLGFPNARFDDQVDALSQLMMWVQRHDRDDDSDMVYPPRYGHKMPSGRG